MAKLVDCLKGSLPADVVSMRIWNKIGEPTDGRARKHGQSCARKETCADIFRTCQGTSMRKRVRDHVRNGYAGSVVSAIRVGTYTTCVCKCKIV